MSPNGNARLRFGDFEFDSESRTLLREGWPVKIQPQPLRVLGILLAQAGEIVSREQLRDFIWGSATYVEFDQGLNYCIRQIRLALRDDSTGPLYIETLPKQGYRFIARVSPVPNEHTTVSPDLAAAEQLCALETTGESGPATAQLPERTALVASARKLRPGFIAALCGAVLALAALAMYVTVRLPRRELKLTQLTDFTDSASAPALSADGRTLAFIRGSTGFLSADQIYAKVLPSGEPRRLTDDPRPKYGLAFSPDSSEVAYTVLAPGGFSTYIVPVLGGRSRRLLANAAALTWLNPHELLFSQFLSGIHMGVVTATMERDHFREVYAPAHERGMAHYAYASPDRKTALVVEMDGQGRWTSCRLISMDGRSAYGVIGPSGYCTSAGWSPDGSWMYFAATVRGQSHLWRQQFPAGRPEQLTWGATEEDGIAVDPGGHSLITSMGLHESAIWIHDERGERPLTTQGEILANYSSPPRFSADGKTVYCLMQHRSDGVGPELWRVNVQSGDAEAALPGVTIQDFDISPDEKLVLFSALSAGVSGIWLAPMDQTSPPKQIGHSGEEWPHFGPAGKILFQQAEGNVNYLEQMTLDGSGRAKLSPRPIVEIQSVSPGRHWIVVGKPDTTGTAGQTIAVPTAGGPDRILCPGSCRPIWSSSGNFLFIPVAVEDRMSPGRSLAIPTGADEALTLVPAEGVAPLTAASAIPGSISVNREDLVPGPDLSHFAYVNTTVHSNLYRVDLP